jgi:transposase
MRRADRPQMVETQGPTAPTAMRSLARKLLVALWKYVTAGVVIEGAIVKSA